MTKIPVTKVATDTYKAIIGDCVVTVWRGVDTFTGVSRGRWIQHTRAVLARPGARQGRSFHLSTGPGDIPP
jgi:hypothetical protein